MNQRPKHTRTPHILLGVFLLGGLAFLVAFIRLGGDSTPLWISSHTRPKRSSSTPKTPPSPFGASESSSIQSAHHPTLHNPWAQKFTHLIQKMALVTDDPESVDLEISNLALTLSKEALQSLYQKVLSGTTSGDEKLLGVELIARSPLPESTELLKALILQDAESVSRSPLNQTEFKAFQLLSIEALGEKPGTLSTKRQTLTELSRTIHDPLLLDRLHRSLWALDGKAPSPQQQDEEALAKLLQKQN